MLQPEYRDSRREHAVRWLSRASWIYAIPCLLLILPASVASPFVALDFGYTAAALLLLLPPMLGIALGLWGRRGISTHEDNSLVLNTRREAGWGLKLNGLMLAWSLVAMALLGGRMEGLQESRDSAAMGATGLRMAYVARGCDYYTQEFRTGWPSSMIVLLESGLVKPADIALHASDAAVLERAAHGDKRVTGKEIEAATGFKYLGDASGIHARGGDHRNDSVAIFSLGKPVQGRIAIIWNNGVSGQIDPSNLDKKLPK